MENWNVFLCFCFLIKGIANSQFIESEDYTNSTVRSRRENTSYRCALPQHPDHGKWIIINGDGMPGDQIDINTILRLECKEGYRLNPNIPLVACDVNWDPSTFPKCEKKCPPFYSTATIKLKCIDRDNNKIDCDQAIEGTYLTFQCVAYYEVPPGSKSSLLCQGGTWDFPKPVCQPVCGKKVNNETIALSYGGREVKDLEYPWVVALYKKSAGEFKNVWCGGSIVSRRVVLTAAHCVTDDYGNALPKEDFAMVAGKYYNAYQDSRDEFAQYRKIAKIIVFDGYRGQSQRYAGDIAILIAQKLFDLSPVVQPVCINNVNNIHLKNRDMGEVAGWGLTENNRAADRLKVIRIPYKQGSTCSQELPAEWEAQYNFFDKICAGHFQRNISVCKGDSGSGLVFEYKENSRYYIHGIVSIAPNLYSAQCNYETNALYTSVSYYYGFVDREMTKNYEEDCILPNHPKNGKWQLLNDADKNPGNIVPSTTILKFTCERGYQLSSGSEFYECQNTYNTPTCSLRCPMLVFPGGTLIVCKNKREQIIDCDETVEGSSITFTCPSAFETDLGTNTSTRYCINGSYGKPRPDCVLRGTGKKKQTPQTTAGNDGIKVICTYASWWAYKGVTPEDFDPTLCTHIVYDFIGLWEKGDVRVQDDPLDLDQEERGLYNRINDLKKKNKNLKVLLSVGGTAASNASLFTTVSKHAAKTGAFLGSAGYFIKTYHFDGLNIDWQYPAPTDKENYIHFLQLIRDDFNINGWLLTASVRSDFAETGYVPKEMNRLLDWVTINSYNFYGGSWSSYTGNHNSLYASSKDFKWEKEHLNIDQVAKNWINAGIDKEKLVVSVAFHARTFTLKSKNQTGVHAPITGPGPGVDGGILRYYEICSDYVEGYTEVWDEETKSPYKYKDDIWIGYNSKDSIWIKGQYVKKNGYGGVNVYPLDGDDNKGVCGEKHTLLKHLHGGLGHVVNWEPKN